MKKNLAAFISFYLLFVFSKCLCVDFYFINSSEYFINVSVVEKGENLKKDLGKISVGRNFVISITDSLMFSNATSKDLFICFVFQKLTKSLDCPWADIANFEFPLSILSKQGTFDLNICFYKGVFTNLAFLNIKSDSREIILASSFIL